MGKKRSFRSVSVKSVVASKVLERVGEKMVLGWDVAKKVQYVQFASAEDEARRPLIVRWDHPGETRSFLALCKELLGLGANLEVVCEATGTYGDAIRHHLRGLEIPLYRVSGKQVHDVREAFDGSPSLHDAKSTGIISWLHLQGRSRQWVEPTSDEKEVSALSKELELYEEMVQRNNNRLEALLAKFWPELTQSLGLTRRTTAELLARFASPLEVASREEEAVALMNSCARGFIAEWKARSIVEAARRSLGAPMTAADEAYVKSVAQEILRARDKRNKLRRELEAKLKTLVAPELLELLGPLACAALVADHLDPRKFSTAKELEKALGLNLVEKSSGRYQGRLHISKRGSARARRLLYFVVLRLMQRDAIVKAWARGRSPIPEQHRGVCAAIAVLRKLVKAIWHVARGERFDSSRLFNVELLVKAGTLTDPNRQPTATPTA